jgi:hypothetical protein
VVISEKGRSRLGRPVHAVDDGERDSRGRLPLVHPAIGSLEVNEAWPVGAIHEHRVLLAEPEVPEIQERVPEPEGIAAPPAA